mmetsp:Transcript_151808/g.487136  ORF Transcript_151808/g.487136 Transcript_151808/m.487136 type:complete len:354 (+) Transcript_151808:613-1674(+)
MQKHRILVQKEGRQQVLQPNRHRPGEQFHGFLVDDAAVTCERLGVEDQEADVPAMPRSCGRVVDGEDHATILLVLDQAGGPEVEDTGDAPDCNTSVGVQRTPRLHREPFRIRVAIACDVVVGHQEMRRVHGVLEEDIPTQLQVAQVHGELDPLLAEFRVVQLLDEGRLLGSALHDAQRGGVRPDKEQAVLDTRGVDLALGAAAAHVLLLQMLWGVGQVREVALPVEAPGVVGAEQATIVLHTALRERCLTVRARVLEDLPLAQHLFPVHRRAVVPDDDVQAHQLRLVRAPRVHAVEDVHRIPCLHPLELLVGALILICLFIRISKIDLWRCNEVQCCSRTPSLSDAQSSILAR